MTLTVPVTTVSRTNVLQCDDSKWLTNASLMIIWKS